MKVLIVDDSETSMFLTSSHLKTCGFDVAVATSAESALKFFMRSHFRLIIVRCPAENFRNAEMIATIRSLEVVGNKHPAEIVATVQIVEEQLESVLLSYGATYCLELPLSYDDIVTAVERVSSIG